MDNSKLHIVVVTGFLEKDGKFLILQRSEKETAYPGKWTVPGGKVEGSDNIRKTLKKEFQEETGITIKDEIKFLGEGGFTRPDGYHVIILNFLCEYESGVVKIDKEDFMDFAWAGLKDLSKYDLIDGVKKDFELLEKIIR